MKKENPEITFLDAYKPPFEVWMKDLPIYVHTSEGKTAFTILNPDRIEDIQRMVSLLNDEEGAVPFEHCGGNRKKHIIATDDLSPVLLLRGWGHLIGGGALNLHPEQAAKIQDEFYVWCLRKILGKPEDWQPPKEDDE